MSTSMEDVTVGEHIVSSEGQKLLKVLSDSYARGDGYALEFVADSNLSTFATTCQADETGKIKVHLSADLLQRAEAEDRLEMLGFATLHELGHVKRFQAQPPKGPMDSKDGYFNNIVDDIAINYGNARRTRFVNNMTRKVYDDYLFPRDVRPDLAAKPRHQQFMETLLVLAMTTPAHAKADVQKLLKQANLTSLDESVVAAVSDVLAHEQDGTTYNLLGQLRTYGDDLAYTTQVARPIREHFDTLYEADKSDQQQQSSDNQSQGDGGSSNSQGEGESFDYSDSASCGHGSKHIEQPQPDKDERSDKPKESSQNSSHEEDTDGSSDIGDEDGNDSLDIPAIAEDIADKIKRTLPDEKTSAQDVPRDLTPEQLEKLRGELNLSGADFANYMEARREFSNEIRAIQEILLQLRHERQNEFLAPGREVAAHGHRIRVDKLVRAIASATLDTEADIWKHPSMAERIDYEFDGLDLYLLCDVSVSMLGTKADAAAASAVVLQEGLLGASAQMAGEHTPIVRLQVQAFGAGHAMLCELTDEPTLADLGRTYSALKHPASGGTQVAGALSTIKPEANRLSVVAVVSDGAFHDESLAARAGQELADKNVAIIQLVFGGANVSKLADNAKRVNLVSARDLPENLLTMLPELIELLRTASHA